MYVYMYVCMRVWVHECMSAWVHQCVSVSVYQCISVSVYECLSISVCECMSIWAYERMSIWMYECIGVSGSHSRTHTYACDIAVFGIPCPCILTYTIHIHSYTHTLIHTYTLTQKTGGTTLDPGAVNVPWTWAVCGGAVCTQWQRQRRRSIRFVYGPFWTRVHLGCTRWTVSRVRVSVRVWIIHTHT